MIKRQGKRMRKGILFIVILFSIFILSGQEIQEEAMAINIEIPVRVFKGNNFIDDLNIEDFEVYEDGVPQKIEAVYLIKKTTIEREAADIEKEEARKRYDPQLSRHFVLLFEVTDYMPKMKQAIEFFFENVITPQDTLTVVTPVKTYRFNKKALTDIPREKISSLLLEKLRKDITTGCGEYHSLLRDYISLMSSRFPLDQKLYLLRQKIREFRQLRDLNDKKISGFADYLKNTSGQKHVFLFYQRELFPYPEISFESYEYLEMMSELAIHIPQNIEKIKQSFSDSSIAIHFLYITKPQKEIAADYNSRQQGVVWQEISEGIFNTFMEMAKSTGGLTESSANIAFTLEKAAAASENYYLLYYSPKNYVADEKFKRLEVKIKGRNYRVTHRTGYIAD
jgi:VWFA-related protein